MKADLVPLPSSRVVMLMALAVSNGFTPQAAKTPMKPKAKADRAGFFLIFLFFPFLPLHYRGEKKKPPPALGKQNAKVLQKGRWNKASETIKHFSIKRGNHADIKKGPRLVRRVSNTHSRISCLYHRLLAERMRIDDQIKIAALKGGYFSLA
jgi:hypothetical protein